MMKQEYVIPACGAIALEAGDATALCVSHAFTDDYTGYDPWDDLAE